MRKKSGDEDGNSSKRKDSDKKQQKVKQISGKPPKIPKYSFANLKNQIQNHVNTKKIVQFVRKSSRSIPHLLTKQQSKALLPKLEKIILSDLGNEEGIKNKIKFEQIQNQLTHSMVMFKRTRQSQNNDLWAIDVQTQKCYKMIPSFYFKEHMNLQQLTKNLTLTKNYSQMQQSIYSLMDYLDQVEFNINQQAAAKIKIFMNFVMCMNSIQDLVNISTQKISATRKHTGILRDIVVSRSIRINQHRLKKERVKLTLDFLLVLKKMKIIQNKLNAQISLGNFISHDPKTKLGSLFAEYCDIHNIELKKFCCKTGKHLCKYWDITYFVEKGYQDNFMKMVRSYLFQLVDCQLQIEKFKKALLINKKNFMTTPSNSSNISNSPNMLDQSYEVDAFDHVELITKIHIERQIISVFEQGMPKYNFDTDNLEKDLTNFLSTYVNTFLRQVFNSVDSDPRQTLKDLHQLMEANYLQSQKCRQKLSKISWAHYDKTMEMLMQRFQYLNVRLFSLIEKILIEVRQLQKQQLDRFNSICGFMGRLTALLTFQIDSYLSTVLKQRIKQPDKSITLFKSKQDIMRQLDSENQSMKKLVRYCTKWLKNVQSIQKSYPICKQQINKLTANKRYRDMHLKENEWSPKVLSLKINLVKNTYELLHKTLISRDLREKLEDDTWQFIQVKTQIYNDLGYIIGGKQFVIQDQKNQRELLSNSLLMEKSMSEMEKSQTHQNYNKQEYSSKFKINPNYITIGNLKFKIVSSTQQMIKMLRKYLQLYDDYIDSNKKQDLQAKITELILMYNQYIKDMILKGDAVKLGKIKTKSITAKMLIIAYIQLQVIDVIYSAQIIQNRIGLSKENCSVMHDKIIGTAVQIRKKYQKIIEMRINDSIDAINVKDENILQNQHFSTIPKNYQSSIELFYDLMLPQYEFQKFLDMEPNWAAQLVNKVGKGPKGKEMKQKYFSYLQQQIKPISKYVPKLLTAIKSVLY